MSGDSNYLLSWDQHEGNRTSSLRSLWENSDFLDVTIACDDGQVGAHKVVLSAGSLIFENILKQNNHSHPLIYLRGTVKRDVELLLQFIYSGETSVCEENLSEFLALANSFAVKGLQEDAKPELLQRSSKKTKLRKRSTKTKDVENAENMKAETVVDISEEIDEITEAESDTSALADCSSVGFIYQNTSTNSLAGYDEEVMRWMTKTGEGWNCTQCSYTTRNKNHMKEHVERYIEGYIHQCEFCQKTFSKRKTLRRHVFISHK